MTALLVVASVGAGVTAVAGATAGDGRHEMQTQPADTVEIDERLREHPDGETIEVVVRMSAERSSYARPAAERSPAELRRAARSTQSTIEAYAEDTAGVELRSGFWLANAVLVELDTSEVTLEELARVDGVTRLHRNYEVEPQQAASSTARSSATLTSSSDTTWGVDRVNAPAVWQAYDTRGDGVKVAVLDTGVDNNHSDIELYTRDATDPTYPGGWAEFDIYGNQVDGSEPYDPDGHGTHVSGTVAGGDTSGTHIGVAPGAELMHGKVFQDDGSASFAQIVAGMEWATDENADVISMSLGARGDEYRTEFIEPTQNANAAGTVVVAAIGNVGSGSSTSPGNVYDTLSVGAIDRYDDVADFSGGDTIDTDQAWGDDAPAEWPAEYVVPTVTAPGVSVTSAYPDDQYMQMDGTSMATPHVAGVIALVLAVAPERPTPSELDTLVTESTWKPAGAPDGQDTRYGYGIVDAYAATQGSLTGTVTATNQSGTEGTLGDATVTVYDDGTEVASTTTNTDGTYGLDLETGSYTVEFDHENAFAEQRSIDVAPGDDVSKDVTLAYKGTLRGELRLSEPTNAADVAVAVTASDADGEAATTTVSIPAGQTTGEYDLTVAADVDDGYTVTADARDYHENVTDSVLVDVNETVETNLTLTARNGSFEGNVTASGITAQTTGEDEPIDNATVTVYEDGIEVANTTTDGDGEYVVPSLAPSEYRIVVDDEYYDPEEWTGWLDPNETKGVDFQLDYTEGGNITGQVTGGEETNESGEGLEGLTVTVVSAAGESNSTTTNATGHYEFTDLDVDVDEEDAYTVTVDGGDTYRNETIENVTVEPGQDTLVDVALPYTPGTLAGEVTLAVPTNRTDVAVTVNASDPDGEAATTTVSIPAGQTATTYNLTVEVDRDEGYRVTANASGYDSASVDAGTVGPGERIDGLDLTLAAENATAAGTVTASGATAGESTTQGTGTGDPVANASVIAYNATGTEVGATTTTDDGNYTFDSLRPDDSYTLVVDAADYAATNRSIEPDPGEEITADVALDYADGGRIEGVVELDVVDPDENATVTVVADDGDHRYTTEVDVDSDASTAEYTLENVAVNVDAGYELVVSSDAAYANGSVEGVGVWVNETVRGVDPTLKRDPGSLDGRYAVNIMAVGDSVEPGDTVAVDATVTNIGQRGYRPVTFTVTAPNGTVIADNSVVPLLAAGAATDLHYEWTASDDGEYTVQITTPDDTERTTVAAERPAIRIGGGGGGSLADAEDGSSFTLSTPDPPADVAVVGERTAAIESNGTVALGANVSLESIAFDQRDDHAVSGEVTVRDLEAASNETGAAPGKSIRVLQILVPPEATDRSATLQLRLSRNALRSAGLTPGDVARLQVWRFADGEWRRLPTEAVAAAGGVAVSAETPGFSYFALVSQEDERTSPPTDIEATTPPTDTETSPRDDDGLGVVMIGFVVVMLLVAAAGALYYVTLSGPESG